MQRKNKEDKRKNQRLVDILRNIISSKVTSKSIKNKLKELEIGGDNYFVISTICTFCLFVIKKNYEFRTITEVIFIKGW